MKDIFKFSTFFEKKDDSSLEKKEKSSFVKDALKNKKVKFPEREEEKKIFLIPKGN
jgi:hypothetical protein